MATEIEAKPSIPSVKLTAFEKPTIQKRTKKMTYEEKEMVTNGGTRTYTVEKQVTETQTVTETSTETVYHTVVPGDTLWDIAAIYYNDNFEWPTIYDANSGQIADPHWIYPGQVLIIQKGSTTTREVQVTKTVTETKTEKRTIADRIRTCRGDVFLCTFFTVRL